MTMPYLDNIRAILSPSMVPAIFPRQAASARWFGLTERKRGVVRGSVGRDLSSWQTSDRVLAAIILVIAATLDIEKRHIAGE